MSAANGVCVVTANIGKALDIFFGDIDCELKTLANEMVDMHSGEVADKISKGWTGRWQLFLADCR